MIIVMDLHKIKEQNFTITPSTKTSTKTENEQENKGYK